MNLNFLKPFVEKSRQAGQTLQSVWQTAMFDITPEKTDFQRLDETPHAAKLILPGEWHFKTPNGGMWKFEESKLDRKLILAPVSPLLGGKLSAVYRAKNWQDLHQGTDPVLPIEVENEQCTLHRLDDRPYVVYQDGSAYIYDWPPGTMAPAWYNYKTGLPADKASNLGLTLHLHGKFAGFGSLEDINREIQATAPQLRL